MQSTIVTSKLGRRVEALHNLFCSTADASSLLHIVFPQALTAGQAIVTASSIRPAAGNACRTARSKRTAVR